MCWQRTFFPTTAVTLCLQMEQERHTDYLSSTKQTDKLKRALDVSPARIKPCRRLCCTGKCWLLRVQGRSCMQPASELSGNTRAAVAPLDPQRERKLLAQALRTAFDEERREQLYRELGIRATSKGRKQQLIKRLWDPKTTLEMGASRSRLAHWCQLNVTQSCPASTRVAAISPVAKWSDISAVISVRTPCSFRKHPQSTNMA